MTERRIIPALNLSILTKTAQRLDLAFFFLRPFDFRKFSFAIFNFPLLLYNSSFFYSSSTSLSLVEVAEDR